MSRSDTEKQAASTGNLPLDALESTIREAGRMMLSVPDEVRRHPVTKEGSANFVTAYDVKVQEFLKARLSELFPSAVYFAEEDGESRKNLDAGDTFIIDPIDGTTNFMCGYDHSAVSVGLVRDGKPLFGAIYNPYTDEYVSAVAGEGAFCNGKRIHVSGRPMGRAIVAIGSAPYYKETLEPVVMGMTHELFMAFADFRRSGSAAIDLCSMAMGRIDAFCEPLLSPWDFAAGSLIVKEAGGSCTDFGGNPLRLSAPSSCVFASPNARETAEAICARYASSVITHS